MAGRIIQLTQARRIVEPPFIDTSIRADIGDYGPPGWHLHGPLALKGPSKAGLLGIPGALDDGDGFDGGACPGSRGGDFVFSFHEPAAGATTRDASRQINRPYIIHEVTAVALQAFNVAIDLSVSYKLTNDETTGIDAAGHELGSLSKGLEPWRIGSTPFQITPMFRVTEVPSHVFVIVTNTSGAGATVMVWVSLLWI